MIEREPRFVKPDPEPQNHNRTHLRPLYVIDTRLDTIVGIIAVVFAVVATLGWVVPQIVKAWE